jgi:hypothetical protein
MNTPRSLAPQRGSIPGFIADNAVQIAFLSILAMLFVAVAALEGGTGRHHLAYNIALGCIFAVTNAFLGYVFVDKAFRYNSTLFLFISFSGMALRFFLTIASIGLVLLLRIAEPASFVSSFMALYTLGMFGEVLHINARIDRLRASEAPTRR